MIKGFLVVFLLACTLLLGGLVSRRLEAGTRLESGQAFFTQARCRSCHAGGLQTLKSEENPAANWQYALLWSPKMLLQGASMPSDAKGFKVLQVVVSGKVFNTPSGNEAYGIKPDAALKKIFSFNPDHLINLYLSSVTWNNPPVKAPGIQYGLKTFTDEASWPDGKVNGYPVAWIPPELQGAVHPGYKIFLIVPTRKLKAIVAYDQTLYSPLKTGWISVEIADPDTRADNATGKKLFDDYCLPCHGKFGNGQGPLSVFLFPKPRDFTSGEFKFKTTLGNDPPTDADLFRTITNGLTGTAMPSFRFLPDAKRWDLVEYVKTFAVDRATGKNLFMEHPHPDLATMDEPKWEGKALTEAVSAGKYLFYNLAKCNDCHGPSGISKDSLPHGDGPSAAAQMDDWGYPIHPADLAEGILKRGNDPADIYLDITTGLMGTPMPTYHDTLTDKERWEIALYVSRLNHKYLPKDLK